jgi:hypothetical protein
MKVFEKCEDFSALPSLTHPVVYAYLYYKRIQFQCDPTSVTRHTNLSSIWPSASYSTLPVQLLPHADGNVSLKLRCTVANIFLLCYRWFGFQKLIFCWLSYSIPLKSTTYEIYVGFFCIKKTTISFQCYYFVMTLSPKQTSSFAVSLLNKANIPRSSQMVWDCRYRKGSIYFSSATWLGYSTILKSEYIVWKIKYPGSQQERKLRWKKKTLRD